MRRLLEILVIHTFDHCGIGHEAKDANGDYVKLKTLINKAKARNEIGLSKTTKSSVDEFRELGNLYST